MCKACLPTIIQSSIWCHCVWRYESWRRWQWMTWHLSLLGPDMYCTEMLINDDDDDIWSIMLNINYIAWWVSSLIIWLSYTQSFKLQNLWNLSTSSRNHPSLIPPSCCKIFHFSWIYKHLNGLDTNIHIDLCNNSGIQTQYPSERRWTFKQIKLV